MGAAKKRRDELTKLILAEAERYERPMEPGEAELRAELDKLPVMIVDRVPAEQLEWMRMKPRECHANVHFMVTNDPAEKTKWVLGWMVNNQSYVLHSIIDRDGRLTCVTPDFINSPDIDFAFDPDLKLEFRPVVEGEERQGFDVYRGDDLMNFTEVRRDMDAIKRSGRMLRANLARGVHPQEALKLIIPEED